MEIRGDSGRLRIIVDFNGQIQQRWRGWSWNLVLGGAGQHEDIGALEFWHFGQRIPQDVRLTEDSLAGGRLRRLRILRAPRLDGAVCSGDQTGPFEPGKNKEQRPHSNGER